MEDLRENVGSFANTGNLENLLIGIAYWLAVIVVILAVFYIAVRINNYRLYRRHGKVAKDDFLK